MSTPSDATLDRHTDVLTTLGALHGISDLRHGGAGVIVAAVQPGRTYLDLARFEADAAAVLGGEIEVVPDSAPAARALAGRPLRQSSAA